MQLFSDNKRCNLKNDQRLKKIRLKIEEIFKFGKLQKAESIFYNNDSTSIQIFENIIVRFLIVH